MLYEYKYNAIIRHSWWSTSGSWLLNPMTSLTDFRVMPGASTTLTWFEAGVLLRVRVLFPNPQPGPEHVVQPLHGVHWAQTEQSINRNDREDDKVDITKQFSQRHDMGIVMMSDNWPLSCCLVAGHFTCHSRVSTRQQGCEEQKAAKYYSSHSVVLLVSPAVVVSVQLSTVDGVELYNQSRNTNR